MADATFQHTLAIVKPDATEHSAQIRNFIQKSGLTIVQYRRVHLMLEQASDFYNEHSGKSFFPILVSQMSSDVLDVMVLAGLDAVDTWKSLIGPTDPEKAKEEAPESLRAIYGESSIKNSVHGSDSVASAEREIHFFFPSAILRPMSAGEGEAYLNKFVIPVLTQGLAEAIRRKPADPFTFLADFLDANNPNVAYIEPPGPLRQTDPDELSPDRV